MLTSAPIRLTCALCAIRAGVGGGFTAADVDFDRFTSPLSTREVQWYPGHIARAEKMLQAQVSSVDVVVELRDARIPGSTAHPRLREWIGNRRRVLVINKRDCISEEDLGMWNTHFRQSLGEEPIWTNAVSGQGVNKLQREILKAAETLDAKRARRGLKPRPVRAAVVGFPNIGKSALINRLLKRRVAASAPRPGVTRQLQWIRVGDRIDLLDSPGILPSKLGDQMAARRLAICDAIGEAAYSDAAMAAELVDIIGAVSRTGLLVDATGKDRKRTRLGTPLDALTSRFGAAAEEAVALSRSRDGYEAAGEGDDLGLNGELFVHALADRVFAGNLDQAGMRLLKEFRTGKLGNWALEVPSS